MDLERLRAVVGLSIRMGDLAHETCSWANLVARVSVGEAVMQTIWGFENAPSPDRPQPLMPVAMALDSIRAYALHVYEVCAPSRVNVFQCGPWATFTAQYTLRPSLHGGARLNALRDMLAVMRQQISTLAASTVVHDTFTQRMLIGSLAQCCVAFTSPPLTTVAWLLAGTPWSATQAPLQRVPAAAPVADAPLGPPAADALSGLPLAPDDLVENPPNGTPEAPSSPAAKAPPAPPAPAAKAPPAPAVKAPPGPAARGAGAPMQAKPVNIGSFDTVVAALEGAVQRAVEAALVCRPSLASGGAQGQTGPPPATPAPMPAPVLVPTPVSAPAAQAAPAGQQRPPGQKRLSRVTVIDDPPEGEVEPEEESIAAPPKKRMKEKGAARRGLRSALGGAREER